MDKKKSKILRNIFLFVSGGVFLFLGVMLLIFAIGERTASSTNFWWIIILGSALCLFAVLCVVFGVYCLKTKR